MPAFGQLTFDVTLNASTRGTASGNYDWDLTTKWWNDTTNGSGASNAWVNGSAATFNAGTGTYSLSTTTAITVGANITVSNGNITFDNNGGSLALSANTTVTAGTDRSLTINNALGGTGFALSKLSAGTLTLAGNNTFTGGITLDAGTLNINHDHALGSGPLVLTGGTIDNTSAGNIVLSTNNAQSWEANFTFAGTHDLNLGTGNVTMVGGNRSVTLNAGTLTAGGVIDDGAGDYKLTKNGDGTLVLSGANTFGDATGSGVTINGGGLHINNASAVGVGKFVINADDVTLDNSSAAAITLTPNNALVFGGNFTFLGTHDLNLGTGDASMNGNRIITVNASTLTVGGSLAGSSYSLTKAGAGTLVLAGDNKYDGLTTVSAGTLTLSGDNHLADGGVTLTAGQLNLNNDNAAGSGTLAINGGTLDNTGAGTVTLADNNLQSWGGNFTFAGSHNLNLGTGAVTLTANRTVTVNANALTVGGIIDDGTSNYSLIKDGAGTLTLSGANTFGAGDAGLTLNAGTLNLNHVSALGAGNFTVNAGTLDNTSGADITLSTNNAQNWGGNFTFAGSNSLNVGTGAVTLTNNRTVTVSANTLTVGGGIDDGAGTYALTKIGTGTLTLNGASAYGGGTTINQGTVIAGNNTALGTGANVTVANNAALGLSGGITLSNGTNASTLRLQGTGVSNSGALYNVSGATAYAGNIVLNGNTTISAATGTLDLGVFSTRLSRTFFAHGPTNDTNTLELGSNTLTLTGTGTLKLNTRINGDANSRVVINATDGITRGIVQFRANENGYTGDTVVQAGKLIVDTINNSYPSDTVWGQFYGIHGNLTIGDGTGKAVGDGVLDAQSAVVQLGQDTSPIANEVINYQSNVAIKRDGYFNLNNQAQSVGNLTMTGGLIDAGSAGLYLNGNVTISPDAASGTSTINGTLSMTVHNGDSSATNRTFTVGHNSNNDSDLTINAQVNNGSLVKEGIGTMTLTHDNTNGYGGTTTINNGILRITDGNALGQGGSDPNAHYTTVASNATQSGTLQLKNPSGNFTVSSEYLYLNGNGYNGAGALQNVAGNNTWSAPITLGSSSRINSDAETLTITSTLGSNSNYNLTVGGAGNVTHNGTLSLGDGKLTKDGNGKFTFSGANGATGQVNLNAGTMDVGSGTGTTTLNTDEFSSASSTTLTIATGGTVYANYATGTTTYFSGSMSPKLNGVGASGGGTFEKDGTGILVFNHAGGFDARGANGGTGLTLVLNGGTLSLLNTTLGGTSNFQFDTIHITADTTLDFNNSAGTFLTSAHLIIDAGVKVTVNNWVSVANTTSQSTVWYVTDATDGVQGPGGNLTLSGGTLFGNAPLGNITFTNYNGMTTTWVSGTSNGWFDKEIRPTPEPSTYGLLLLSGCAGLLGWRRQRARRSTAIQA